MKNNNLYDVIIIGSGPAGLCAAIYAGRAMLNALIIEKNYMGGGQIINTYEIDNYPGFPSISGFDLSDKMTEHADKFGIERVSENVVSIDVSSNIKKVITDDNEYESKTLIIATGNSPAKLNVPGETEFSGKGVSYCATCDGAFYKDKITAVIGGGNVAAEDALFLSRICSKVYLVHRRDELRADKILADRIFKTENIEFVKDSILTEIKGTDIVSTAVIKNVKTDELKELDLSGVFIAVGNSPNGEYIPDEINKNEKGYIIAGEDCITNISGVFAAGDIRAKRLRQVVAAVSDGANAVYSVQEYLIENGS